MRPSVFLYMPGVHEDETAVSIAYVSVVMTILCIAEFGYNLLLLNYSGKQVPEKGTLIKNSERGDVDIGVAFIN